MAASDLTAFDKPQQSDLDRCVHCGLCLNACPTYRELHVEMDSPRGRIYQMVQVAGGAAISPSYIEHIDLCLACRGCETACPSGVQYGRLVEAARAEIESKIQRPWRERLLRWLVFRKLLPSRRNLEIAGALLYLYQASGLKRLVGTARAFFRRGCARWRLWRRRSKRRSSSRTTAKRCRPKASGGIAWRFWAAASRTSVSRA